jgi:1-acyl-sn-glycerol-3-phosphate acyltransferase
VGPLKIFFQHPIASLHLGLRFAALVIVLAACLPGILFGPKPSAWPRRFLVATTRILGVRVTFEGNRLVHDVFHVANHIGWIDIPILGSLTGTAFVAQDKIRHWPIVGWLARLNNTVFVSRTDKRSVGKQVEELRAALARHQPIAIFPEGTTTDGRSLLPFKPSLFAVMIPPPRALVIQPVALCFDDIGRDLAWIGVETAPQNAWRIFTNRRPVHCHLRFLDPFDPGALADRKAIATEARHRIGVALAAHYGHPVP